MRKALIGLCGALAAMFAVSSASAQQTLKIGIILPYSGQFADAATQMDNAIKLYVKQHGDTVAGKKLEFIRKDTGGIAPDRRTTRRDGTRPAARRESPYLRRT